jgi:hypothetical protein
VATPVASALHSGRRAAPNKNRATIACAHANHLDLNDHLDLNQMLDG